jgi:hypothetical protein
VRDSLQAFGIPNGNQGNTSVIGWNPIDRYHSGLQNLVPYNSTCLMPCINSAPLAFQQLFRWPLIIIVNNPIARYFYRNLKAIPDWQVAEIEPIIPLVKRTPWI